MGMQRLGPRKLRRLALRTGLPITRGWARGYWYNFYVAAAPDQAHRPLEGAPHRHAWYDLKTRSWTWAEEPVSHLTSCRSALW